MSKQKFELAQVPIIKHQVALIGKEIDSIIAELNIDNLVATDDTIQNLKDTRAKLNSFKKEYESQRIDIKKKVAEPYMEFEEEYKVEVLSKLDTAESTLKDKIGTFEQKVKDNKKIEVQSYFEELCKSEEIDFVTFEQTKLVINLSTTVANYNKQCDAFITKIKDDLVLINTNEFKAEILAEYKLNLNASKAITNVQGRKEREKQELIRIEAQKWEKRVSKFRSISMILHANPAAFVFDDEIYIGEEKVRALSDDEFTKTVIEFEEKIKAKLNAAKPKVEPVSNSVQEKKEEIKPPVKAEPLKAPVKEVVLETLPYDFRVICTLPQAKSLVAFLKENNIEYKSINN